MPLPQLPNFEALLGSVTAERPQNDGAWLQAIAVPRKVGKDLGGLRTITEVAFWYLDSPNLSLESFLRRVAIELDRLGHPARPEIVLVILGIFARIRRSSLVLQLWNISICYLSALLLPA